MCQLIFGHLTYADLYNSYYSFVVFAISTKLLKAFAPGNAKLPEGIANSFRVFGSVKCLNLKRVAMNNNVWQFGGSPVPVWKAPSICCTLPLYLGDVVLYIGAKDFLHGFVNTLLQTGDISTSLCCREAAYLK